MNNSKFKKIFLTILLSVVTFLSINAQKIEMKKVFGGYTFSQNDKTLTVSQMQEVMKNNKEAFDLVKSAKSNQTWGMVLGGIGGGLIGYPIGTAVGGRDPKWALAGVGAALIVATIPIIKGFNRKTKKAVELFNANQPTANSNFKPQFNLNLKRMSMGISMTF